MELNQIARDGSPRLALQSSDVEKEHMFEKVVTPSDVGKLNRLVIPKQYAEKYFPLDASSNEKGLLLNFEDRHGKPWRFRYSYWNSSQSYVMTKGWSRFVKEKRLDAGDTVLFGRGLDSDRLFIDWRRRPESHNSQVMNANSYPPMVSFARSVVPWGRLYHPLPPAGNSCIYVRSTVDVPSRQFGVKRDEPMKIPVIYNSIPVSRPNFTGSKRLRLFGVNLDCGPIPGPPSVAQVGTLPPLISLQLSLGGGGVAVADVIEPPEQGKPALSLDLGI